MNDVKFAGLMKKLGSVFGAQPSTGMIAGYSVALGDIGDGDLVRAFVAAMRVCKHMPRPAEIRELAVGRGDEAAERAWDLVVRTIGRVGRYRSVTFDDGKINASIRSMGGWPRLCSRGGEDFATWAKKEFIAAYSGYVNRAPDEWASGVLCGDHRDEEPLRIQSPHEALTITNGKEKQ